MDIYINEKLNFKKKWYCEWCRHSIKKKNVPQGLKFSIRFHIYPGISAIKTISGQSILLQINQKNLGYLFLKTII